MKSVIGSFVMAALLTVSYSTQAKQDHDNRGLKEHSRSEHQADLESSIPCGIFNVLVEGTDPDTGFVTQVRIDEFSAERQGGNVTFRRDNEVILTIELPGDPDYTPGLQRLVERAKALNDICAMNPREQREFARVLSVTLSPRLEALGFLLEVIREGDLLVLILVIELIIIGAGFGVG